MAQYSKVGRKYPAPVNLEKKPLLASCSKPGLCDPEQGSFVEHCRLCNKVE